MVLLTSILLASSVAQARVGEVNDWVLHQNDGSCSAIASYGRDILVRVSHDLARNEAHFSVVRPVWRSIEEGRRYQLRIDFSNGNYYDGPPNAGVHIGEGDTRSSGITATLNGREFLADFAGAAWMEIRVEGTLIASLNLRGTRAVMSQVRACSARAFREDTRDPFARLPSSPPTPTSPLLEGVRRPPNSSAPPSIARLRSGSISNADMPMSSIRAGSSGTTRITMLVDATGVATDCSVTGSSGDATLDAWTCTLAVRRFRFTPATRNGQNVVGTYSQSVRWVLPDD